MFVHEACGGCRRGSRVSPPDAAQCGHQGLTDVLDPAAHVPSQTYSADSQAWSGVSAMLIEKKNLWPALLSISQGNRATLWTGLFEAVCIGSSHNLLSKSLAAFAL